MAWISDFMFSSISDALLPKVRPLLEDVIYEILNDRQVPTRTDFREIRDLVNNMRGTVSQAGSMAKKLAKRLDALEAAQAAQADLIAELQAQLEAKKPKPATRKKATTRKKSGGAAKSRKAS